MSYSMSDLLQMVVCRRLGSSRSRGDAADHSRAWYLDCEEGPAVRPEDTEELMRSITSEDHIQQVRVVGRGRFRFCLR